MKINHSLLKGIMVAIRDDLDIEEKFPELTAEVKYHLALLAEKGLVKEYGNDIGVQMTWEGHNYLYEWQSTEGGPTG